jgi:hypothetical protein
VSGALQWRPGSLPWFWIAALLPLLYAVTAVGVIYRDYRMQLFIDAYFQRSNAHKRADSRRRRLKSLDLQSLDSKLIPDHRQKREEPQTG